LAPTSAGTEPLAVAICDALAGTVDPELRDRLGPEVHDHLRHLLRERTRAWARSASSGGPEPVEVRRADELVPALAGHDGPVVVVAPDVPGLGAHHLAAVLDDLADGVTLAFAPATDGAPFLLALGRPDPDLLADVGEPFDAFAALGAPGGGSYGMLRPERRLASLADARALRADPVAPAELRALLPARL
jgi:hypothetical protein